MVLNKIGSYEIELLNLSPRHWRDFLLGHSSLPGPRANIELAKAFANVGTLMDFKKFIALGPEEAPGNTPEEFLTFCGVLGFGEYLAEHHDGELLRQLRERANDPRWRIREVVAMALQTIGRKNMARLTKYTKDWIGGSFMEQRAAIAALCEPDLLTTPELCQNALELLDWGTAAMIEHDDKVEDEGYRILRKGLSYAWSVVVAAYSEKGKSMMERWIKENHPIVNSIMRENLKKKRLTKIDPGWTERCLNKLSEEL